MDVASSAVALTPTGEEERSSRRGSGSGQAERGLLYVGTGLVCSTGVLAFAAYQSGNSTSVLLSLAAALVGLTCLGCSFRRFGFFSIGGVTWAMVAVLFIGRWFFPPVSQTLLTPSAWAYYDRDGALVASAVMILVFALTYAVCSRPLGASRPLRSTRVERTTSPAVADLALAGCLLVALRVLSGVFLQIGIPGREAVAVPFVGVIYYLSSYGPLVAASLILWYGRNNRSGTLLAAILLLCWALIEAALGSHGSAFQAIFVFGATKAMVDNPLPLRTIHTVGVALLLCGVVTAALFFSFVARQSLNGGARQSLGEVPAFVFNRLGGIEYVAPVIGAVNRTGDDMSRLRSSTWSRYMTADVYGLPPESRTGFAATAIGWWYGVRGIQGVIAGSAICGLLAAQFDRWCQRRRNLQAAAPPTFAVGVLLGWATFLLGGTIGSLGGISIGFAGIAVVMERTHRVVLGGMWAPPVDRES